MTDRELLELAAKAAGVGDIDLAGRPCVLVIRDGGIYNRVWNPLTDDGDALRLAVKLQTPLFNTDHIARCVWGTLSSGEVCDESAAQDPYAATRRAIVRAAAEIGRSVK